MKEVAKWLLEYFDDLISKNAGQGRSIQSWMYLVAGVGIIVSAVCMAFVAAFVAAYAAVSPLIFAILAVPIQRLGWAGIKCATTPLDTVFWGAYFICLTGTWTAALGYIASAKKNSTNATKEIALAGMPAAPQSNVPATTSESSVTVTKASTITAPAPQRAPIKKGK